MLQINLLPENLRVKKKNFEFPIFPLLFFGFLILLSFFLILRVQLFSAQQVAKEMKLDLQWVSAKSREAGRLQDNILQLNYLIENVVFKTLIPKYSLTLIFDKINSVIPDGMWLNKIRFYSEDEEEFLEVGGFVKPVGEESMIAAIGDFNNELKEFIQKLKIDYPASITKNKMSFSSAEDKNIVDFEMTTKRRKAERIEITEFSTIFTL